MKALRNIFFCLAGCSVGLLIILATDLPNKWLYSLVAGLFMAAALIIITGGLQRGLEAFLILSVFVNMNFHLGYSDRHPYTTGIPITLTLFAVVPLYATWLFKNLRLRHTVRLSLPITISLMVLFGLAALSLVWAPYIQPVISGLVLLAQGILCFLYFACCKEGDFDVSFFVHCVCAGLMLNSAVAAVQYFFPGSFGLDFMGVKEPMDSAIGNATILVQRATGFYSTPNELARMLVVWLPTCIIFLFSSKNKLIRVVAGIASASTLIALFLTYSRGGFVSLLGASAIGGIIYMKGSRVKQGIRISFLNIILACVALSIISIPLITRVYERFTQEDFGAAASRITMAKIAIDLIADNPFLGVGLNSYTLEMHKYDKTYEEFTSTFPYAVHNQYLLVMGELGFLALLAFVALTFAIIMTSLKRLSDGKSLSLPLSFSLLLGLIAFLIDGMFEGATLGSHMMMNYWVPAGVIAGTNLGV